MQKSKTSNLAQKVFLALLLVMSLAVTFVLSSCTPTADITFEQTAITMYTGDSETIEYTTRDEDPEIEWTSSNEDVVSVRRGTLRANAAGTATVTATVAGGGSATCEVTVIERVVTISQTTATIDLDSDDHTVTLTAESSDGGDVTWSTSDSAIATVSGGVVTATGYDIGTVTITASRGNASASCVVSVVQPSRPADWYRPTSATNSNTIADPGVWHWFADGSGSDCTFVEEPLHQNNSLSVTIGSLTTGMYFYFRYQPTFEHGAAFTISFDLTVSADATMRMANGNYGEDPGGPNKQLEVKAGETQTVYFEGIVNSTEPFSIRPNACAALDAGEQVTITLANIKVEEGHTAPEAPPQEPHRSDKADMTEYDITLATNGEIVIDRGAWYYSADGTSGTDYAFAESPRYENGTATFSFANIASYNGGSRSVYQLRYQPDFAVGTWYTLKATVNLSAAGTITYGTKVTDSETYYYDHEFETAGDFELEFTGYVNGSFPFSIGIEPADPNASIALTVSDITVTETTAPEPSDSYQIRKAGYNSDIVAEPGTWFYKADGDEGTDYVLNGAPSYDGGNILFALTSGTPEANYQLAFQPEFAVGTEYTVTFTATLTGNGYFVYSNDYENSNDLTANGDGSYTVTYTDTVDATMPFLIGLKSNDGFATPLSIAIDNITFTEVTGGEPSDDESYTLAYGNKATTVADPGTWYYFGDGQEGTDFTVETATYAEGVVTFALSSGSSATTANYKLNYQLDLEVGTEYTLTCTVKVTGDADDYILAGDSNKQINSKDLTANDDGSYTVSWTGTVSDSEPFMVQIKSTNGYNYPITLVVSNVVITPVTAA